MRRIKKTNFSLISFGCNDNWVVIGDKMFLPVVGGVLILRRGEMVTEFKNNSYYE